MLIRARSAVWLILVLVLPSNASYAQRVRLAPQLRNGQTLIYQLDFSAERTTKTGSHVTMAQAPPSTEVKTSCLLQVTVTEASRAGFRLSTAVSERTIMTEPGSPTSDGSPQAAPDKIVEVQIAHDGTASDISGFDELTVAQQLAWNSWLAQFTSAMTFPVNGVRPGGKWQRNEPETSGSPLAKLIWLKKYEYVRDEPCSPGETQSDPCAVVLVQAFLSQERSVNKTTPEDFRMRGLVTRGSATGTNETILYLAKNSGVLVRATENVQQAMEVTIALADGSNSVHYSISAKSRSQAQLVPDTPKDVR